MTETPNIYAALSAVMSEVQTVRKTGRNTDQNYNFRGVDAVVNAVGPMLRKHSVLLLPELLEASYRDVRTSRDKPAREVTVKVRYAFIGPAGDKVEVTVPGESMDSGDKGTAKAMSVAYRIAILQALCIPTDEPDPDESSYERATFVDPIIAAKQAVVEAWEKKEGGPFDAAEVADRFKDWSQGAYLSNADAPRLLEFAAYLNEDTNA